MQDLKYWLAFSKSYAIGTIHLNKLLKKFPSIKEAWNASASDLLEVEGFSDKVIQKFIAEKQKIKDLNKIEEDVLQKDIKVITLQDEDYPCYLKQIYDPPIALFVKGDLKQCNLDKCLAVVGSRKASHYIKEVLRKIITDMKGNDITIVSGMAIGVDSTAHIAAMDCDLKTIAVIGSGFDYIYPKSNKQMFENIIEKGGAVISEYFPEEKAAPWKFPRRNRIISGLSQGTLVAEAGLKSGALITANLCLDQNRELMCIPGMVTNPNTEGSYKLIKSGAGVITCAEDVFRQLNWEKNNTLLSEKQEINIKLLDNEAKVYKILDLEAKTFDTILEESKLSVEDLMIVLTTLELNELIEQLPGQQFVKKI